MSCLSPLKVKMFGLVGQIPNEKPRTNQEDNKVKPEHNAKPEHNKDGKANDKPGAVAGSEDVEEDVSDEESEEESEGETDSDEYTTGTESSGSHSEHSASDKEVS